MKQGFTLIELVVVIAIIAVLSGIILFSINVYVNKGKDSNIAGNLAVLVPAGEVWYNMNSSYSGFCSSAVAANAISQMPENPDGACYDEEDNKAGLCCAVSGTYDSWAACANLFSDTESAYCVDSRGVKKEIPASSCASAITACP